MRAREFTINIPVHITINGDGDPVVSNEPSEPVDDNTGTFMPPLQQKMELLKKSTGVKSKFDADADETEDSPPQQSPLGQRTAFNAQADDDEPIE